MHVHLEAFQAGLLHVRSADSQTHLQRTPPTLPDQLIMHLHLFARSRSASERARTRDSYVALAHVGDQ